MKKHFVPRTKIVCTLGPASSSEGVLRNMVRSGMDFARINFSHGTHSEHLERIKLVRTVNRKNRRHIRLLADLAGPRVRLCFFRDHQPKLLEKGKTVSLFRQGHEDEKNIPFDYEGELTDFRGAGHLFLDDGNIILKIKSITASAINTRVVVGGLIKERKAVNFPGAFLKFPPISEKDLRDLEFIVEQKFDYIAQSFVRNSKDVLEVRNRVECSLPDCKIIAKIENEEGLSNIDSIIDAADGIMIARGDLGVCVPIYKIPLIQKAIIKRCLKKRKLVITATQMLEHMVDYLTPTRAEVTDIANAVLDGTSCVMLSAETAVGKFPVETVDMMNMIIKYTELNSNQSGKVSDCVL